MRFRKIVGEAIGEASMCWSDTPTGIFESSKASKLVDNIVYEYDKKVNDLEQMIQYLLDDPECQLYRKQARELISK